MTLIIADRVKETTTTTGTGTYTLAGAATGYRAFSSVCANADTAYYCCEDGTNWEIALGTWATGGTLARTTILASSNANAAVNWTAGTRNIFLTHPATLLEALSAGTFSTLTATTGTITTLNSTTASMVTANATTVDTTNLEVTNLKAKDGTAAGSIADATGVVTLASAVLTTADINGGTIDGAVIGGSTPAAATVTSLTVSGGVTTVANLGPDSNSQHTLPNVVSDTVTLNAATQTLTNKTLTNPAFSGATANMGTVTTIDINGGTIDGAVIGGTTRAAVSGTSGNFNSGITVSGGVAFPATQVTSSDPNTLDDYEEGTWTPAFSATGATFSHQIQSGLYTKIGRKVTCYGYVLLNNSGNVLSANALSLSGLPFALNSATNAYAALHVGYWQGLGISPYYLSGTAAPGAILAALVKITAASAASVTMVANDLNATGQSGLIFEITYFV